MLESRHAVRRLMVRADFMAQNDYACQTSQRVVLAQGQLASADELLGAGVTTIGEQAVAEQYFAR
jgi:hypothetical protein